MLKRPLARVRRPVLDALLAREAFRERVWLACRNMRSRPAAQYSKKRIGRLVADLARPLGDKNLLVMARP